jgi:hypothetical protein
MIDGKIIEQVTEFNYLGSKISEYKKDMEYKLQQNQWNNKNKFWQANVQSDKTKNTQHNSENSLQTWK